MSARRIVRALMRLFGALVAVAALMAIGCAARVVPVPPMQDDDADDGYDAGPDARCVPVAKDDKCH